MEQLARDNHRQEAFNSIPRAGSRRGEGALGEGPGLGGKVSFRSAPFLAGFCLRCGSFNGGKLKAVREQAGPGPGQGTAVLGLASPAGRPRDRWQHASELRLRACPRRLLQAGKRRRQGGRNRSPFSLAPGRLAPTSITRTQFPSSSGRRGKAERSPCGARTSLSTEPASPPPPPPRPSD